MNCSKAVLPGEPLLDSAGERPGLYTVTVESPGVLWSVFRAQASLPGTLES